MSIAVTVELPEEIVRQLSQNGEDVSRSVLEFIAIEGYRSERLTGVQVMRMLGLQTRLELDAFLKAHQVYLDYTIEEVEKDTEVSRRASSQLRGKS
jgi:hypothetical protein